ncbi:MAG TPA: YggS family pyridoxal phosphate-dependent enzyme [Firmicutes bacterium]|jgi:pyridoxal phosphate enzyme (YggS family)|nr:YggS family pyridoxal phosphate-dependent enzyme [Bacillota bacterium]
MSRRLQDNLDALKAVIHKAAATSLRKPEDITLIAVSKTRQADEVRALHELGVIDFGENRVQEAVPKIDSLADLHLRWHFIGSLQTNKVRQILPKAGLIHSLDRWSLAKELQRCASNLDRPARCLVQVNIAGEASKSGLAPQEVKEFVQTVAAEHQQVQICGLMTIAPQVSNPEEVRGYFRQMKSLFDELATHARGYEMKHLSMGMSGDFQVAIEEGATMVRIGTAIFGRREG